MEVIYPEIALKHPKADPRTVLLLKRNFIESSSDHIQDFYNNSIYNHTTANCDKIKNNCKYLTNTTTNANKCSSSALVSKLSSTSSRTSSTNNLVLANMPSPVTTTNLLSLSLSSLQLSSSQSSSSSSSLLSNILVKFSKSCHFNASFNKINHNLYKTQKTKLIFFLLFIWCAILIQTTQAVPVRRVSTSGRKLILHTNVYRERYHQKLLEEQRQHQQHQQQIQHQLKLQQEQQQKLQRLQQQLQQQHSNHYPHHRQQQQQQQPEQIVQKNHIYSPGQTQRHHSQPQIHHRHHLHQRAAPITSSSTLARCSIANMYTNLHSQMNASMITIKDLCEDYLSKRGNESYENMATSWNLISLQPRNPNRKPIHMDNELHRELVEFYRNLHNYHQLIDYATQDTFNNQTIIEHGEEINISVIINFMNNVKNEIDFNVRETENLLALLGIEKPDLADNNVVFNDTAGRRVRDFLIIKNLIEELERVMAMVQKYCETNN